MRITNTLKNFSLAIALSAAPMINAGNNILLESKPDTFVRQVPPKGTNDSIVLKDAPSAAILINGEKKNAALIVDLTKNILYKYNKKGIAENAYLIASGKASTPTKKGVRIVTHIETYPFKYAPVNSKRRKNPRAYGPKIICLNKINPKNGEQSTTGQFLHGTNEPSRIGKYVSHGCMRMDNDVIKQLAAEIKRGDIVIIK